MKIYIIIILLGLSTILKADDGSFFTKSASLTFFSSAPLEDIEANSNQATSAINTETGEIAFKVLMKSFQFEKALMQEHFNVKFVESEKFPYAKFIGKIEDLARVNFDKTGIYQVVVNGKLTIHGVTNNITAEGFVTIAENVLIINSTFNILVADFNIKIPNAVKDNIAKEVEVTVNGSYEPIKK